jgi:hypothetical protein
MFQRRARAQYQWIPVPNVARPSIGAFKMKTAPVVPLPGTRSDAVPSGGAPPSLRDALATLGLPQSNLSSEDELVDLLMNASEIEQGLLIQYLYAAYSATNSVIAGIVKEIAIEEMGHLITVQNILLACGQPIYLALDDWTTPTRFHPFRFTLEPAGRGSLAKYTAAEMPDLDGPSISPAQKALLPSILADAKASAKDDVQAHRVGLLYMKIYWLLRGTDAALTDPSKEPWLGYPVDEVAKTPGFAGRHVKDGFLQDLTATEGLASHWRGTHVNMIVAAISDRQTALQAVADVSAQGEGFSATPDGHFGRFLASWLQARDATGPIARNLAIDPWYALEGTAQKEAGSEIANPIGLLFAKIVDGAYAVCLLAIALNLILPSSVPPATRRKAARAAITCMKDGIGIATVNLRDLPVLANGDDSVVRCGPPFSIPPVNIANDVTALKAQAKSVKDAVVANVAKIDAAAGATQSQIDDAKSIKDSFENVIWPLIDALPAA